MIFTAIGVTGWTLPQIMALTFPQLGFILGGQGQILYPRLKIHLDTQFGNLSSKPHGKETESDIDRVIREHEAAEAARKAGKPIKPTFEQSRRALAYRYVYGSFLPPEEPGTAQRSVSQPLAGLLPATARAIVAHAEEGGITGLTWARDVAPLWLEIKATAALP